MTPTQGFAGKFAQFALSNRTATGLVLALLATSLPSELSAADDYQLGPDSKVQDGVPQGTVTKRSWKSEKIYAGTERDYWVYVPRQYDPAKPACVHINQDSPR